MNKESMVYIHDEVLFSHKNNEIIPFVGKWMELEAIMLSKASQTLKEKFNGHTRENI
jgi:hypothetical protein